MHRKKKIHVEILNAIRALHCIHTHHATIGYYVAWRKKKQLKEQQHLNYLKFDTVLIYLLLRSLCSLFQLCVCVFFLTMCLSFCPLSALLRMLNAKRRVFSLIEKTLFGFSSMDMQCQIHYSLILLYIQRSFSVESNCPTKYVT